MIFSKSSFQLLQLEPCMTNIYEQINYRHLQGFPINKIKQHEKLKNMRNSIQIVILLYVTICLVSRVHAVKFIFLQN